MQSSARFGITYHIRLLSDNVQTIDVDNRLFSKSSNPTKTLRISAGLAKRLQRQNMAQALNLDDFHVDNTDHSGGYVVTMRGQDNDLSLAETVIRDLDKSKKQITTPSDIHGLIIGKQWQNWNEMVIRCGGPEDSRLQALMIEM